MTCCQCEGYDSQFGDEHAKKDLDRYHKNGPDKTTRLLIDALKAQGVDGASLLDVGAGIGVVHHELLSAGAMTATHVDATAANIAAAEAEATRKGHRAKVTFVQGDFVARANDIPPADVVTLDRVICCYPDMESLVAASAGKARRLYGAVYPRERWFIKGWLALDNWVRALRRNPFRSYVHSVDAIDAAIGRQGLRRTTLHETFVWRVAIYTR